MRLSRFLVVSDVVGSRLDGRPQHCLFATRTGAIVAVPVQEWASLLRGEFAQVPGPLLRKLADAGVIVDPREDELAAVLRENRTAIAAVSRLFLAIQPTANCQLACDYCGQRHRHFKLSDANLERLELRVRDKLRSGRYRELRIGWFGGEPLLAMDVIRKLTPRLRSAARTFRCGYTSEIVTNGLLLTPQTAAELIQEHGVTQFDVTLDGMEAYHDRRRVGKAARATFWRIFDHVRRLVLSDGFRGTLNLRCNIDARNRDGVAPFIALLAGSGILHRLERFTIVPVRQWANDSQQVAVDPREFAAWELPWLLQLKRLGFHHVPLIPPRTKIVCFAVEPESEDIDAYGNLYNCSELSYVPAFERPATLGNTAESPSNLYQIDTLRHGEIPGARQRLGAFNDEIARGAVPCRQCPILPVCGGSCPKSWRLGLTPCPSFKFNMPQRMAIHQGDVPADNPTMAELRNQNFWRCLKPARRL